MKTFLLIALFLSSLSSFSQCVGEDDDFYVDVVSNNPSCFGYSDGSINLGITGIFIEETYSITDIFGTELTDGDNSASELPEGWYYWAVYLNDGDSFCGNGDSLFIEAPGEIDIDYRVMSSNDDPDYDGWAVIDTVYNYQGDYSNIAYFWNPDPAGINGIGADSAYSLSSGEYLTHVNDEFGCTNLFTITIGWFASIEGLSNTNFTIIANSFSHEIQIEMSDFNQPLAIDFFNTAGKQVYTSWLSGKQTTLNPQLNAGIYIYSIREESHVLTTGKFMFE